LKKNIKPFEVLYHAFHYTLELIEKSLPPNQLEILQAFMRNYDPVLEDMIRKAEDGNYPTIGFNFSFPQEFFACFDCIPLCVETAPYFFSAVLPNGAEYFYDKSNAWGHPYHTCTSQKGVMGMVLSGMLDLDLIVTPTAPCDNAVASYQWFSEHAKIPSIYLDLPNCHDERGYDYFAGEMFRLIDEMGKILGQEPDYDRFKQSIQYSRQSHENLMEIHDMRKKIPSPIESMANPIISGATTLMPPCAHKAQFFKEANEIVKHRVKNDIPRAGFEKVRSVWPYMSIFFDISLYEWMDRKLGMTQLSDLFGYYFYKPIKSNNVDEIIRQLAAQGLEYPMIHQSTSFLDTLIDDTIFLVEEYSADCAVITEHIGCKQMAGISQVLREALRDEKGIPTLIMELDVGDKRFTPLDSIKNQMSEFVNTLL